jgi:hypothetical protein
VSPETGEIERGYVAVADMCVRQPCDTDLPVHVYRERRRAQSGA